jgi:hypothetical protein
MRGALVCAALLGVSAFTVLGIERDVLAQAFKCSGAIGCEVAIPQHLQDGEEFTIPLPQLIDYGHKLFDAKFTVEEGAGRPLGEREAGGPPSAAAFVREARHDPRRGTAEIKDRTASGRMFVRSAIRMAVMDRILKRRQGRQPGSTNNDYWFTGSNPTMGGCLSDLLASNTGIPNGCNPGAYGQGTVLWRFQ